MHYIRRSAQRFFFRLGHGCRSGGKMFAGLAGGCGTAFGLMQAGGWNPGWPAVVSTLSAATVGAIIWGLRKAHVDHIPDTVIIEDDHDGMYEATIEPKDVCLRFNREAVKYFGRDCIDDSKVEAWRSRNPQAFICLMNKGQEACAAMCAFALRSSFLEQFVKGRLAECDIEPDDILDIAEAKRVNNLYLAAIIVDKPHSQIGHRRAAVMIWALIQYIKKVYGTRRSRMLYAVPVNRSSENLLKRLGFHVLCSASARKDRHDLYALELNSTSLRDALLRVGDYSHSCRVKLDIPNAKQERVPKVAHKLSSR